MSVGGVLLGLVYIAIVVVLLLLIGAIGKWILGMLGYGPPGEVERLFLAVVALIALYMLIALLFGLPTTERRVNGDAEVYSMDDNDEDYGKRSSR